MSRSATMLAAILTLLNAEASAVEETEKRVGFSGGFDVATHYFFRGFLQEDQGVIFQPWAEVGFALYEGDESSLTFTLGTWNSLHSGPSGSDSDEADDPASWYESDFYAGLSLAVTSELEVGATYTAYTSPNGLWSTVKELSFSGSFDDSAVWSTDGEGFSGLQPSLTVAFETDGQVDGGDNEGVFLELGVSPSLEVADNLSLELPVSLGLSLSDYFEDENQDDETFGYLSLSAKLSTSLASVIPESFGSWGAYAGVTGLILGDTLETVNNGDSFELIGSIGIDVSF